MTDTALIKMIHEGSQESLGILYEKYFDRILQYSYRRTFDKQIAYDITANVFLKVAEKISKFKPQHENAFIGWLFKIASSEVIAYYRKPEKYKSSVSLDETILNNELEADAESEANLLDTVELYKNLHKALKSLGQKEQTIVDLYYFENLSYKEISLSTGIKESNVGVILHRTVTKLHEQLQPITERALL